jgi:hypothetical protein
MQIVLLLNSKLKIQDENNGMTSDYFSKKIIIYFFRSEAADVS